MDSKRKGRPSQNKTNELLSLLSDRREREQFSGTSFFLLRSVHTLALKTNNNLLGYTTDIFYFKKVVDYDVQLLEGHSYTGDVPMNAYSR